MAINSRYEFTMIFDVENGNPNGDPDAGNNPRVDPETSYGYITDVCIKRKIRNFVELAKDGEAKYNILIKPDRALNEKFSSAYDECGLEKKQKVKNPDDIKKARDFMCENYFDVRTFGAVMSTGDDPCGIVRGPVQINFAKSLSPVYVEDITITRQARTTIDRKVSGETEMGRKSIIPYALYRADGYISAALAQKVTGFDDDDLEILWQAIINMFENDHSAARGKMCMRKLFVFKHSNVLGNCPSHILFDKIHTDRIDNIAPPRAFSDYKVYVDEDMPDGVEFMSKI